MTLLHLIRHGRASALEDNYDQLQPLGELQAQLLGRHLHAREQRYDALYVGPLVRQRETLRLMREAAAATGTGWPQASVLDGLAEGPFEVLMKRHVRPRLGSDAALAAIAQRVRGAADAAARDVALAELFEHMAAGWRRGEIEAADLEPAVAFSTRVANALAAIAQREGYGREVAVVTSNGVINELLVQHGAGLASGARHRLPNASVSLLELAPAGVQVRAIGSVEHLADPAHLTLL